MTYIGKKLLTLDQILSNFEISRMQIENGETKDFDSAIDRIEKLYFAR